MLQAIELVTHGFNKRIDANLLVERDSQKRIVVGRGGEVVKRIGVRSRRQIEALLGARVLLTGILPTLIQDDLSLENMTPSARYARLNEVMSPDPTRVNALHP